MKKIFKEVFFDVETKRWFSDIEERDPSQLGVSICSVYSREVSENFKEIKGEMKSFWENELSQMWSIFQEADRVIGFNSIYFDIPALKPYSPISFPKLPHFDIMAEIKKVIGRRISLDALAKSTIDKYKIDAGENAIIYFDKGDKKSLDKLKKYCEEDVVLTRDLYDYALKNKELKFLDKWNTLRTVKVDFSYPEETINNSQVSFF
ncbi:ribonuclease H-like domain-containing protein [Patescibacteria group bacterium]|nr:ribonuclease H-like domain-containing protein [Patescibacteria group bacterium]MBU2036171.1 ribonuclease H-like domain-containing protein [Patescibacteria group bacterium]